MRLYVTILLFVSSLLTFGIGAEKFFARRTALFKILITSSIGCFMFGKCYELVNLYAKGTIPEGFHVGMLATIGGFRFLFSASYSQMDGLVDDHSKKLRIYRLVAFLAPLAILAFAVPIVLGEFDMGLKVTAALVYIFIAQTAYFNLKHLIIPDVSCGIIASIRGYSLIALLLEFLTSLQILADKLGMETVWIVSSVLIAIAYPCLLIAMVKGSKKWTI